MNIKPKKSVGLYVCACVFDLTIVKKGVRDGKESRSKAVKKVPGN